MLAEGYPPAWKIFQTNTKYVKKCTYNALIYVLLHFRCFWEKCAFFYYKSVLPYTGPEGRNPYTAFRFWKIRKSPKKLESSLFCSVNTSAVAPYQDIGCFYNVIFGSSRVVLEGDLGTLKNTFFYFLAPRKHVLLQFCTLDKRHIKSASQYIGIGDHFPLSWLLPYVAGSYKSLQKVYDRP